MRLVPEFRREIEAALEEIRAAEPRPQRALADAAHRLAGSAATLGAERLAAAARALEAAARRPAVDDAATVAPMREAVLGIAAGTREALDAAEAAGQPQAPAAAA
jgi:HPt (histidine-containing phosphotransfer) domain-containing protein